MLCNHVARLDGLQTLRHRMPRQGQYEVYALSWSAAPISHCVDQIQCATSLVLQVGSPQPCLGMSNRMFIHIFCCLQPSGCTCGSARVVQLDLHHCCMRRLHWAAGRAGRFGSHRRPRRAAAAPPCWTGALYDLCLQVPYLACDVFYWVHPRGMQTRIMTDRCMPLGVPSHDAHSCACRRQHQVADLPLIRLGIMSQPPLRLRALPYRSLHNCSRLSSAL